MIDATISTTVVEPNFCMSQFWMSARNKISSGSAVATKIMPKVLAAAPADKWNVARLAKIANLAPFHLCHVFRELVGTSVYNYVLQERLARALDHVMDQGDDLTAIAMQVGFASHSHFTERFRRFFGCTPAELRRNTSVGRVREMRKIMIARLN